jgi:hypothetical protein
MIAAERSAALVQQEVFIRTYHMGCKPTSGINYDDRLTARLKCSATTAYKYLELPVKRGGLRHARLGKKYLVTEQAVRDWLGDLPDTRR